MLKNNIVMDVKNISKCYPHTTNSVDSLKDLLTNHLPWNIARARREARLLNRTKNDFWALKDISFSLKQGDVLGVIGHNGAGKSTLLKILSQVILPTSGEAYIKGRISSLLEVGTGFHPELTGLENIYISGNILGMSQKELDDKLEEIIDFSELKDFLHVPVKKYSSGMMAKLGFSVAAHLNSDIMIIDEVLSVGDAHFKQKSSKKMLDLIQDKKKTILFVSHSEDSVKELCNQAIMLEHGEVVEYGSPDDVFVTYNDHMEIVQE